MERSHRVHAGALQEALGETRGDDQRGVLILSQVFLCEVWEALIYNRGLFGYQDMTQD